MGWLSGYGYCKAGKVNATAAGAQTNYQMKLLVGESSGSPSAAVHCDELCTDFPNDIRFTKEDGITVLDYCILNITGTSPNRTCTFWIKIPSIPATGTADIFLYYSKAGETSASDPDETFFFYEPFNTTTLNTSRWPNIDGNVVYSINTSDHYIKLDDIDTNVYAGLGLHSKIAEFPSEYIIESAYGSGDIDIWVPSTGSSAIFGVLFSVNDQVYSISKLGIAHVHVYDPSASTTTMYTYAGVNHNNDWNDSVTAFPATRSFKIWKLSGEIHVKFGGAERVVEASTDRPDRIHIGPLKGGSFPQIWLYAFKVRAYASPEPTWDATWSVRVKGAKSYGYIFG